MDAQLTRAGAMVAGTDVQIAIGRSCIADGGSCIADHRSCIANDGSCIANDGSCTANGGSCPANGGSSRSTTWDVGATTLPRGAGGEPRDAMIPVVRRRLGRMTDETMASDCAVMRDRSRRDVSSRSPTVAFYMIVETRAAPAFGIQTVDPAVEEWIRLAGRLTSPLRRWRFEGPHPAD